ncbi:MAG: multiheme c-type cytochrome [Thermoanaerobaculia bacterium]|nr:multiheme c-type cytochrome [Thermoanaerobaculia bacterium]
MSQKKKTVRIGIAIVLMFALVWIAGELLYQVTTSPTAAEVEGDTAEPIVQQEGQFNVLLGDTATPPEGLEGNDEKRNLKTYYERRAYQGAPPYIPHEVEPDMQREGSCLACHRHGGYTPRFEAFAPATPHPHLTSCEQCHVTRETSDLFRGTSFETTEKPELEQRALPGSPNPIPHGLQMRENCASCHAGPTAPEEIRTDHPDRPGCLQCHVVQESDAEVWTRSESFEEGGE